MQNIQLNESDYTYFILSLTVYVQLWLMRIKQFIASCKAMEEKVN